LETSERHPGLARRAFIADVRDRERLVRVFEAFRPELVFHAAALKHVPLVEANAVEGATTNVLGTVNLAEEAIRGRVAAVVMISTDKAVNPTSVMGATKRIAESYCQALDLAREAAGTRFITVRFGNVLGSTGSVVPLFQRQLAQGGPLTVTHRDMTRYFMTVKEAVELVLQASALGTGAANGKGGREGKIMVLDMGEPIRIMDLAEQMIRLAGFRPGKDIKIEIVGPRPGEKLSEEVFHGAEAPQPTECPGVLLAAPRAGDLASLRPVIAELEAACHLGDQARVLALIRKLVPEYRREDHAAARAARA